MDCLQSFAAGLLALAMLAGCAGNGYNAGRIAPGTPREEVLTRAGEPSAIVALPGGGQRLQYSMQPFGQHAYMVDLDAAGRVVRARQVLNALDFQRIQVDAWTAGDVQREFGRPARLDGVSSWNGPIMTYRWTDGSDMFYYVYLDAQGVVRHAHPAMEFVNAPHDRD